MRWERLFEDLEGQLAAEWESERAALDSEGERLRLSRLRLRERILVAAHPGEPDVVAVGIADGSTLRGAIEAVGVDFAAIRVGDAPGGLALVRLEALATITAAETVLLRSARPEVQPGHAGRASLSDRLTLGFVLRDLARRRSPVRLHSLWGAAEAGTIDRVGADHLDLAVHEAGSPRRTGEVSAFRLVPFAAIAWVMLERGASPTLL